MSKLSDKDMVQLEKWIGGGPKTFTLLYSITRDGCDPTTFHSKCNNQGPTVTVLYNSQGTVYGGYTGVSWAGRGAYTTDSAAFLFRIYHNSQPLPIKFPRKDSSTQDIYDNGSYGPTFGGGHDLNTFRGTINKSGTTFPLNGHVTIGNTYTMENVQKSDFNNDTMVVTELEVYKVAVDQRSRVEEKPWRRLPNWNKEVCPGQESVMDGRTFERLDTYWCLLGEVQSFQGLEGVDTANILLIGPVGAGKSSFINTVNSVMKGSITQPVRCGSAEQSLTTAYRQLSLTTKAGDFLNLRLCDTRGLEESQGLDILELEYLLEGHIPNFYEFNPTKPIAPDTHGFIAKPSLADKIHCAVFVIDATTLDVVPTKVIQKMKTFLNRLNQKSIPSVIILTKVDRVCPEVESDVSLVYKSTKVKDEVEKAADSFGLPRMNVLPMKNYENELTPDDHISLLTLISLKQILDFSKSFMEFLSEKLGAVKISRKQKMNS